MLKIRDRITQFLHVHMHKDLEAPTQSSDGSPMPSIEELAARQRRALRSFEAEVYLTQRRRRPGRRAP